MTDAPILFSGPMVRALLDGRKTQTRRIIKPQPVQREDGAWDWRCRFGGCQFGGLMNAKADAMAEYLVDLVPYDIGDRLWVREAWAKTSVAPIVETIDNPGTVYRACDNRTDYGGPWKPSIHMRRVDSRLTLVVTEVRVQRLQDISETDAIAEGIEQWATVGAARTSGGLAWGEIPEGAAADAIFWIADYDSALSDDADRAITLDPREAYRALWDSINGDGAWHANPWVIATTFIPFPCNVDQLPEARHADAEPVDA